jgi:molybdate transport system substrate-binding protein
LPASPSPHLPVLHPSPLHSLVSRSVPSNELTVSAAISLKDSLDEIARLYHVEAPRVIIHYNYGASGTLQRQVEQGAPVDIFISASRAQMDALESRGFVASGTRRDLVRNEIVLIVHNQPDGITGFASLSHPDVKIIAIGDPRTVPAGKYAAEVLTHLGLYDALKPKFVLAKDVRQALTYVATGNADAGIVYATDAKISADVTVVAVAPPGSHSPIVYPAAILKSSRDSAAAAAYLNFLSGSQARAAFRKFGFLPAD